MIFQLRLFTFIFELVWVNGLLVGFSLPDGRMNIWGLNLGPLCLLAYPDEGRTVCEQCLRPLKLGLHGTAGKIKLCKRREGPSDDEWQKQHTCPYGHK